MSTVLVAARPGKSRAAVADLRDGQPTYSSASIATARLPVLALVESELCSCLHALSAEGIELALEPFPSDQIATIDRTELERVSTVLLAPGSLDPSLRRALIARFRQLQKAVVVIAPTDAEACVILAEGATGVLCSSASTTIIAAALWSAAAQLRFQARLLGDIRALESQLTEGKIIGHAKSILAEQLQLSMTMPSTTLGLRPSAEAAR